MAYLSHDKLWKSEFYNSVSAKYRVQDINPKQIKLKINDTFEKDETTTTNFETSNDEHVLKKLT